MQFKRTQNPFTLTLYPVSHTEAIESFRVDNFVGAPLNEVNRATSGKVTFQHTFLPFSGVICLVCEKN